MFCCLMVLSYECFSVFMYRLNTSGGTVRSSLSSVSRFNLYSLAIGHSALFQTLQICFNGIL